MANASSNRSSWDCTGVQHKDREASQWGKQHKRHVRATAGQLGRETSAQHTKHDMLCVLRLRVAAHALRTRVWGTTRPAASGRVAPQTRTESGPDIVTRWLDAQAMGCVGGGQRRAPLVRRGQRALFASVAKPLRAPPVKSKVRPSPRAAGQHSLACAHACGVCGVCVCVAPGTNLVVLDWNYRLSLTALREQRPY